VRFSGRIVASRLLSAGLAASLLLTSVTPAFGVTNAKIEARKQDAARAQAKLDDLSTQLELRAEELGQVESQLEKTRASIAKTERELDRAERDLADSQDQLANRAASMYRNGRLDPLAFFVGVTDFADLLTRVELFRRIGRQDADTVSSVRNAKHRVELAKSRLEQRESEQSELRVQARGKQDQVAEALENQKSYLSSIRADVSRLIAEERKRQERIAAERARRLAAALRAQQQAHKDTSAPQIDVSKLGGAHAGVVLVAMKYLGVPYVWGGASPTGFDCSGLVQYCYSQVGIQVPRTARDQYYAGSKIPANRLDLLQPGDLVFFAYNNDPEQIHHVGIYAGGGTYIHAPQTGDVVRVSSLQERISSRGDYVGACRP
jgi:cell wall-associated NlpC family hydrolase